MFTIKLQFHIFSCLPIMENVDKEADKVVDVTFVSSQTFVRSHISTLLAGVYSTGRQPIPRVRIIGHACLEWGHRHRDDDDDNECDKSLAISLPKHKLPGNLEPMLFFCKGCDGSVKPGEFPQNSSMHEWSGLGQCQPRA